MSEEIIVPVPDLTVPEPPDPTIVIEPVVAPVIVAPPAPVEKRFEYQPTDAQGRPLGGKQVIKYVNDSELPEKLVAQNTELVRKLREITKKQRLGISDDGDMPADVDRLPVTIEFKEMPLSVEERYAISQDLNDPAKFEEARDRLFESGFGAKPKDLRDALNTQQKVTSQLLARANASVFMETHPEFYQCEENLETVVDWMVKKGLQPTVKNFEFAQSKMNEAGLLISSPIVREEAPRPVPVTAPVVENTLPNPQATAEPVARISDSEPPQVKRQARVPSGLNSQLASNTGITPATGELTLTQVERMSSDEYKRHLLTDPKFSDKVNALYASVPPRPRR